MKRFLILSLVSIAVLFVIAYFSLAIYIDKHAETDSKTKSDVIVVLGARSYIEGKYNPCLEARVAHAVALYKAGNAPKILVSGGYDREDNVSEAETMKKIALELGVSADDILLEKNSISTYENLLFSQKIVQKNQLHSVTIVTEPFHAARTSLVAEKLGLTHTMSPAKDSPCWLPWKYATKYFLKEPLAILMYKLQNKL